MESSKKNGTWQQGPGGRSEAPGPRICMPTNRNFKKSAYQCAFYEAQDVLREISDVDLIPLELGWARRFKESWLRFPLYHDMSKKLMFLNLGVRPVRLTREYDLFIATCQNYWDLPYINAIYRWKDHCKTSICWIDEIWAAKIPGLKYWLHALTHFDHIFVASSGSVSVLSKAINRPCHWLPPGVDALRFSPYPAPSPRTIDVYSIGRRWEGVHQALLQAGSRREIFYVYDTLRGIADMETYSYQQHRDLLANVAKRSRFFMVAPAKMNIPEEIEGQVEIGYRYFEGTAAGAVMIGQAPSSEAFTLMFPWQDAVIPIQPDGSDAMRVITDLESDPNRLSNISRRNAVEALLRHDWVYRWKAMFRVARIEPTAAMAAREHRLKDLAELAMDDGAVTVRSSR